MKGIHFEKLEKTHKVKYLFHEQVEVQGSL